MTVEFIPEIDRLAIARYAKLLSFSIKERQKITDPSLLANIERRLKRRAMREYLTNWKLELLEKYRSDPDSLVIPTNR